MTDSAPLPGEPESTGLFVVDSESAGGLLRRMREAAGMDMGVLAAALKVPVQKIEALEADDLAQLPNLTFARGLAGSICRTLRTDATRVLALMPAGVTRLHEQAASIDRPFRRSGDGPAPMIERKTSRPLLILVAVVLLALALLYLWPSLPIQLGAEHSQAVDEDEPVPAGTPLPPASSAFVSEQVPLPATPPQEAPASVPAPAQDAPAPAPARASSAPASAPARAAPASAPARGAALPNPARAASAPARNAAARSNTPASAPARSAPASAPAAPPRAAEPEAAASAAYKAYGLD